MDSINLQLFTPVMVTSTEFRGHSSVGEVKQNFLLAWGEGGGNILQIVLSQKDASPHPNLNNFQVT